MDDDDHRCRSPEPMSLNQRLFHQLSKTRRAVAAPPPAPTSNPNPNPRAGDNQGQQTVQLPGRCRLHRTYEDSASAAAAATQETKDAKEESISDILDEFSFRLGSLSIHKDKPSKERRRGQLAKSEEAYFSSNEGDQEEEGGGEGDEAGELDDDIDEGDFKIVPRNMKNCYFSDEESGVVDGGAEVAKKKILVAEYLSDEDEVVEVEEFKTAHNKFGDEENNLTRSGRKQGSEVKPSAYRSMGRTTERAYFSDDDEVVEIKDITSVSGSPVGESDPKEEEAVVHEEKSDFALHGVQEGREKIYKLPDQIYGKLYPHQRVGIGWLWGLHCKCTGGILGDDMGLGKTMQAHPNCSSLFVIIILRQCVPVTRL